MKQNPNGHFSSRKTIVLTSFQPGSNLVRANYKGDENNVESGISEEEAVGRFVLRRDRELGLTFERVQSAEIPREPLLRRFLRVVNYSMNPLWLLPILGGVAVRLIWHDDILGQVGLWVAIGCMSWALILSDGRRVR